MFLYNYFSPDKGKKRERPSTPDSQASVSSESSDGGEGNEVAAPTSPNRNSEDTGAEVNPAMTKSRSFRISEERSTLAQKLALAVPDADIKSPRVIIVGGQTAGKTKLIISLVFYHLVDNAHFTDEMGEQLLKIFRTGTRMVTRRPTTIEFSKSPECKITLRLEKQTADYPSAEFSALVEQLVRQSKESDGEAYEEELRVCISAPNLPNQCFTDLPGLTTKDKQLKGSIDKSITSMVKCYMRDANSTVVVVEPATAAEDFETSQISPIMRDICQRDRPDIFENSVLVLSKCDRIRDGLENEVMDKIELTSSQFKEFPYKHVVGVINKIEGQDESENMSFDQFKQIFRETKEYERNRFAAFLNTDGQPCDPTTQCTTSAVFHKMELISFNMIYRSIQGGIYSIEKRQSEVNRRIKKELAPRLSFYDQDHPENTFCRMTFIEDFQSKWDELLCREFDHLPDKASNLKFINDTVKDWPEHQHTSLTVAKKQRLVLEKIKQIYHEFVDADVKEATLKVLNGGKSGCFSESMFPFHRIDRFPKLCKRIEGFIREHLDAALNHAKNAVNDHVAFVWDRKVPAGWQKKQFSAVFEALHHIAIRTVHEKVTSALSPASCFALDDTLFEESEDFTQLRQELEVRPFQLSKQLNVLYKCTGVTSNDQLREVLELHLTSLRPTVEPSAAPCDGQEGVPMENDGESTTTTVAAFNEDDENAYWVKFWTTAWIEAVERERIEMKLSAAQTQSSCACSPEARETEHIQQKNNNLTANDDDPYGTRVRFSPPVYRAQSQYTPSPFKRTKIENQFDDRVRYASGCSSSSGRPIPAYEEVMDLTN